MFSICQKLMKDLGALCSIYIWVDGLYAVISTTELLAMNMVVLLVEMLGRKCYDCLCLVVAFGFSWDCVGWLTYLL